ncbi:MAG: penicillin-binding transpeptidase domain-containing protein, partial [Alphaproteobacteria bacterium]
PLNYALAFEKKLITPATVLNDIPTCFSVPGQPLYCPTNYDGSYRGPIQVRFALGNSVNIPAVKVLALNGLEDFIDKAKAMGITTFKDPSQYGLSLTLGGGEVTMYDLATAFSAFANLGIRQDLYAIQKVEDLSGRVLYEHQETEGPRVLPMGVAYLISHILLDNNARSGAFGARSYLAVRNHPEVSVKTGTTNDRRDAWTIGFTPSFLVAVWVGNNDNTPMAYSIAGATGAAPIWNQIMSYLLKDKKQEWPLKPDDVVGSQVCALSGQLPNPEAPCETRFEYFLADTVPSETENLKQWLEIDKTTGQLATDQTPPENREQQEHPVIIDPLGTKYCLDCPPPQQPVIIKPDQLSVSQP